MNINITTSPTGRSPENKFFFGNRTKHLDMSRPKYNKIGVEADFKDFHNIMYELEYNHNLVFYTCGFCFRVETNDDRHAQFVRNMFTVEENGLEHTADWTILHNTDLEIPEPKIYVHLDEQVMLIAGTTFLGEIKKGVFGIVSFETPANGILPMHCSAFTYQDTTNLMFGLSGTGKTTLSSDPDYQLISDDEVIWEQEGIQMIETGCYAKSEGLSPETHKTIFDAVELAKERNTLVIENPNASNARLSYPIDCVENAYHKSVLFEHPKNIFFLTMDAKGVFPPLSRISGDTVRRFFETGYTSQMPGTEAGTNEIKPLFSPCYGSPFMPREVKEYSDLLMQKVHANDCKVYLINTGMDTNGKRFDLEFTRNCVKTAIDLGAADDSSSVLETLEKLISQD
tara:strand:+ start:153 stop:1346 length:1194 start_codon:yes stop_codon:yes gene_type:complete